MRKFYIYRYIDKNTNEIMYIGKTARLFVEERIKQHKDDAIGLWASNNEHYIEFIELPKEEDMNYIESYLIRKFMPKYNIIFADDSKLPPFEIIIDESLWKNYNNYINEKEDNERNIENITENNIRSNIVELMKSYSFSNNTK